jgi:hypothetical protein
MIQPVTLMIVTDNRLFGECLASQLGGEPFSVLGVIQTGEYNVPRKLDR